MTNRSRRRLSVYILVWGTAISLAASPVLGEGAWEGETRLTYLFGPAHDPAPRIDGDTIHVLWSENIHLNQTSEIMYLRSRDRGITWEPPRHITSDNWVDESPDFIIHQGTLHAVYTDYRDGLFPDGGEIYYLRSPNGGDFWESPRRLSFGSRFSVTPRIAAGPDGVLCVAFWDWRNFQTDIFITRSTDNGQTWESERIVTDPDYRVDSTHPTIAVDHDNVLHLVWMDTRYAWPLGGYSPNTLLYARSWDGGLTWSSPPMRIGVAPPSAFIEQYSPQLRIDRNNTVHLVYWADAGGSNVFYRNSRDGGTIWSEPRELSFFDGSHPPVEYIEMAFPDLLCNEDGSLDLVYFSHYRRCVENLREAGDVFLRRSTDGGANWGPQIQMSQSGRARVPKLAGAGDWKMLVWEDERDYQPPYTDTFGAELYYRLHCEPHLPDRPLILLGGFGETALTGAQHGMLRMAVMAFNPSGRSRIDSVELCYAGEPLGLELRDDGASADFGPGDSVYGIELPVPAGAPDGEYLLEVKATDDTGDEAWWPYLTIHGGSSAMCNGLRTAPWFIQPPLVGGVPPNNPFIQFAGYWYTDLEENVGGQLTLLAVLTDARGIEYVSRVELCYGGIPTGILLDDTGPGGGKGDWTPGDGLYTFTTVIPDDALTGLQGEYLLQIAATDVDGDTVIWPELRIYH
ncbi:exo-alpha-sialidase [bacterium]|nr:exo-alpha-sialidase [candidate division CSSED10-310 bacterium]